MLTYISLISRISVLISLLAGVGLVSPPRHVNPAPQVQTIEFCSREFLPVSPALTDLGDSTYTRMDGTTTSFTGGLYPNGSNERPAAHTADGKRMASLVMPRNANGAPDPDGKIGLLAVGMSNTHREFAAFMTLVSLDETINPSLRLVNGAQGGMVASEWIDPQAPTWNYVDEMLVKRGVTAPQIQVAWVKQTNFDINDFPADQYELQDNLETILHHLKSKFPNLALAYFSSRTRSYYYWLGHSPEPGAFESAFAVKWLVEDQINGDPNLNFDPENGPVVAPYVSWGPYLWADGHNPRSDGLTWMETDMVRDCTHPSPEGANTVAQMLIDFLKEDETSSRWFLAGGTPPTPPDPPYEPTTLYMYFPYFWSGWVDTADPGQGGEYYRPR